MILLLKVIATVISCGGCTSDFFKSLDKNPSRNARVHYPFNLSPVQPDKLMHKPSFSVMWKIDMFCMLRTSLVRRSGLLHERYVQSRQLLRKVSFCCVD